MKVAVLMGGWSAERAVSLVTGAGVAEACERLGHEVVRIDMGRDVAARLADAAPDVVFNALHGTPGEDGSVQGMLDLMGLAYTHSRLATSVVAIDKQLTKQALVPHGIRMPAGHVVRSETLFDCDPLPRPYVLKPVNEGSSVGVAIVTQEGNYGNPIGRDTPGPWQEFDELLAEPFIRGRELTTAVLGDRALGVTELKPRSGFYDYDSKYTDGLTEHICPADIPVEIADACLDMALRAHWLLGCAGTSRSDFRWDDERGVEGLYLLEVNTQPGMTPLSLVPEQAKAVGIGYDALVAAIIDDAVARSGHDDGSDDQARRRRAQVARKGKATKRPSLIARTIARVPVSAATIERTVTTLIMAIATAALIAIVLMLGLPAKAGVAVGEAVGRAGLSVRHVEITGIDRMNRLDVYAVALDQRSIAMPLVDLAGVREKLMRYGWVADARVSRRLPDTLVVDIVERKPAAVWQHDRQLLLVDAAGVVLEPVKLDAMPDLPLVIGPDANVQSTALTALMSNAPQLQPMLAGATWVGDRRWDLKFQSGEVLALPAGDAAAATALRKFAGWDSTVRLLGRGLARFDMRDPATMYVRRGAERMRIDAPADLDLQSAANT